MANKQGHYRVYEYDMPGKMLRMMEKGALDVQIMAKLGICKDTFYRWVNEHEEFGEAYRTGMPLCESWWIEWGQKGMQGEIKGFNFNAWIAFMNNKFKWKKDAEGNSGSNTTNNITVQNMNVLQTKSRDDLIQYINKALTRNSDLLTIDAPAEVVTNATGSSAESNHTEFKESE